MSRPSYAILDENGKAVRQGTSRPFSLSAGPGECLSLMQYFPATELRAPEIKFSFNGAEGTLTAEYHGTSMYDKYDDSRSTAVQMSIIGEDWTSIEEVADRLKKEIGVIDLTPRPPQLPDLRSRWERIKFLLTWIKTGRMPN